MKKGNVFIISGLLLIAAALLLTAYNFWDDTRAGKESDALLSQLLPLIEDDPVPEEGRIVAEAPGPSDPSEEKITFESVLSDEIEYPDYVLDPTRDMPVAEIDGNAYVGVISIPAIDREMPVFDEWNYSNLKSGPCRYIGTAYLDNMVICAHNYGYHFGPLKELSYGDAVTFTDMDGNVFEYRVVEIETVDPYDVEKMITGDWDLTLFTCTLGGAARVTVRCEKTAP